MSLKKRIKDYLWKRKLKKNCKNYDPCEQWNKNYASSKQVNIIDINSQGIFHKSDPRMQQKIGLARDIGERLLSLGLIEFEVQQGIMAETLQLHAKIKVLDLRDTFKSEVEEIEVEDE